MLGDFRCDTHQRCAYDIAKNDVPEFAISPCAKTFSGMKLNRNFIQLCVCSRDLDGRFFDIGCGDATCSEFCRGDGKDAAPATDVEDPFSNCSFFFKKFEAESRGGMFARTERLPRIENKQHVIRARDKILPAWYDDHILSNASRLEMLLPDLAPVFVGHFGEKYFSRSSL